MASAIALPEHEPTPPANGMKRRQSDTSEQDSKRQRTSPGKNSPSIAADRPTDRVEDRAAAGDRRTSSKPADTRRKSGAVDEKQRSKRLFGSLLGNLNQSTDRTSKRRQEIESRRKAELQKQDDERLEDRQRRLEKLAQQRDKEQKTIDEQNVRGYCCIHEEVIADTIVQMRIRHSNLLNTANFLQTTTEPRLVSITYHQIM